MSFDRDIDAVLAVTRREEQAKPKPVVKYDLTQAEIKALLDAGYTVRHEEERDRDRIHTKTTITPMTEEERRIRAAGQPVYR